MGGRGAKSSGGKGKKTKKGGLGSGGVNNAGTLPQSTEAKLNPIQIRLKKKLFTNYHERREQWKQIGSRQTINYDKSDNRITRTQGEGHVSRVSRWRKDTYFRDYKTNNKSAVQIQSGKMKKRWAEHFNEHHNARRDGLNNGFVNARRIRVR
ncbi:hypothetical protein [Streptococcus parasanguinis]|uniref:hypothetical protein n=1 Tax=Streptococcus parasanguinis TaxID=1318 RepID=UPI00066EF29B|nr:hypothetical protein [Streptococcus parasanguinis]